MTIEEIRRNAPEGSTHYIGCESGGIVYYKHFYFGFHPCDYVFNDDEWKECLILFNHEKLKPL